MTDEQRKKLERRLWDIADELRGEMNADEFRDYMLGFIFYKYLSERMEVFADDLLSEDEVAFTDLDEAGADDAEYLAHIRVEAVRALGYYMPPPEPFCALAERGRAGAEDREEDAEAAPAAFILGDRERVLGDIQRSTMGEESEDDFFGLFEDMDLQSSKLGRTPETHWSRGSSPIWTPSLSASPTAKRTSSAKPTIVGGTMLLSVMSAIRIG